MEGGCFQHTPWGSPEARAGTGLRLGPDTALPSAEQGPRQKDGDPELEAMSGHPQRAPDLTQAQASLRAPPGPPGPSCKWGRWTDRRRDARPPQHLPGPTGAFREGSLPGSPLATMC